MPPAERRNIFSVLNDLSRRIERLERSWTTVTNIIPDTEPPTPSSGATLYTQPVDELWIKLPDGSTMRILTWGS